MAFEDPTELDHSSTIKPVDLLTISEIEQVKLENRVKDWDGTIRLFIHPFFISANYAKQTHQHFPGHEKPAEAVSKLLSLDESKTPPIIIFEEYNKVDSLAAHLTKPIRQNPYVVSTDKTDPAIYGIKEGYPKLKDLFSDLGVKRILIGGQFLWIDPNTLQDKGNIIIPEDFGFEEFSPWLGGCTGKAIELLNDPRFSIEISNFAFPHNRETLKRTFQN